MVRKRVICVYPTFSKRFIEINVDIDINSPYSSISAVTSMRRNEERVCLTSETKSRLCRTTGPQSDAIEGRTVNRLRLSQEVYPRGKRSCSQMESPPSGVSG